MLTHIHHMLTNDTHITRAQHLPLYTFTTPLCTCTHIQPTPLARMHKAPDDLYVVVVSSKQGIYRMRGRDPKENRDVRSNVDVTLNSSVLVYLLYSPHHTHTTHMPHPCPAHPTPMPRPHHTQVCQLSLHDLLVLVTKILTEM